MGPRCLGWRILLVRFIIGCAGPSNEEGDFETLQVEIGPDIVIGAVDVSRLVDVSFLLSILQFG